MVALHAVQVVLAGIDYGPHLQTLENFCDLALELWDNRFPCKLVVHLQFGDGAIRAVDLYAMRVRVEDPDELDTSTQPLRNFCFEFIRGVMGRHGFNHQIWGDTTVSLRWAVLRQASTADEGRISKSDSPRVLGEDLIPTIRLKDQSQIVAPYKVPNENEYIGGRITRLRAHFALH